MEGQEASSNGAGGTHTGRDVETERQAEGGGQRDTLQIKIFLVSDCRLLLGLKI